MASARPEAPVATFSYAQAAKGKSASAPSTKPSSAGASGTVTPASNANTEPSAPNGRAEEASISASKEIADSPHSAEISKPADQLTADDIKSLNESNNTKLNDNASDSVDTVSSADKTTKTESSGRSTQATEGHDNEGDAKAASEEKPAKPVYTEAKPPSVNIWAQRAAVQKAKAPQQSPVESTAPVKAAPEAGHGKLEPRRKSEQGPGRDMKRADFPSRQTNDFPRGKFRRDGRPEDLDHSRKAQTRPRDRANSELPPSVGSELAWPKPTDVLDDERKRVTDKEDKAAANNAKSHGKTEWTRMAYTPTAVFETRIEGRGAGRMGKGVGKNGQPASARGPPPPGSVAADSHRSSRGPDALNQSRPNGRAIATKADRDTISPQTTPKTESRPKIEGQETHTQSEPLQLQTNGIVASADGQGGEGATNSQESAKSAEHHINKVTENSDESTKLTGSNIVPASASPANSTFDAPGEVNGTASKQSPTEKRSDNQSFDASRDGQPAFREGKRGGRKAGRGGFNNNASFTGPNSFANGFQDFSGNGYPVSPSSTFFPARGNGGNRGYRNQGMRSQSIPVDQYGRHMNGFGGYPMLPPMQTFVPEFYGGPYSAGAYPYPPTGEDPTMGPVQSQIEYYFSVDNLVKDVFLRKHMDSQGWIFLHVIAQFNRLKQLTTSYDVLKAACLQSNHVEIKVGEDGKERLRKGHDWERWVLPKEDRDSSARTDGPTSLRRPSPVRSQGFDSLAMMPQSPGTMQSPHAGRRTEHSFHIQDAASAPFFPGMMDPQFLEHSQGFEEVRGRQSRSMQQRNSDVSPLMNGLPQQPEEDPNAEPDRFPSSQIENLTVVVRKHDAKSTRPPMHTANSRTFSNGSIDSRNIMQEVMNTQHDTVGMRTNGSASSPSDR